MDQMVVKSQFLKTLTKFAVVSIWVLSLFFSHNFYFSRFTIRLVTHAIDKNYMFLFCNGLLVFVAKYSGLITSTPREEKSDKAPDCRAFETEFELVRSRETECLLVDEVTETRDETDETASDNVGSVEEEHTKDIYVVQEDQEEQEHQEEEEVIHDEEDDGECDSHGGFEEEEESVGVMTAEEMNKKFDEFIRKMKEELRIEARRHLILV